MNRTEIIPLDYASGGAPDGKYQQVALPASPRKLQLMGMTLANTIA